MWAPPWQRYFPHRQGGMVSLAVRKPGRSERILTKLRSDGYTMSPDYAGADVVLVNTCGFLDSAKERVGGDRRGDRRERAGDRHRLHGEEPKRSDALPVRVAVTGADQY